MPIAADLHNHTHHSHAKDTVAAMAVSAFDKGLKHFGFSEHSLRPKGYAYPQDYQPRLEAGLPLYAKEVAIEQERYKGRMQILFALEIDYMVAEEAYAQKTAAAHEYDYVIGGLHFQGHWGFDFSAADWETLSDEACGEYFFRYYSDLRAMAATGLFQIAAHPDLIKLFRKETFAEWIKKTDAQEAVRSALAAIKTNGAAMEISSAGLRKKLGEPYPGPVVMRLAGELDLPVAFGSDAHAVADVAFGFDVLAEYAQSFGYSQSAVFEKRAMRLIPFV